MTLQNFEKARTAMVLSQLQPSGVISEQVMAAYQSVPREMFVPNALRGVCYLDDDIPLENGRVLMEPLHAALSVGDKVLDVGGATGYSAAVLAQLGANVVAIEQEEKLLQEAYNHWKTLGLVGKITPVIGDHTGGYVVGEPYKAIIVNGAVASIPFGLMTQLAEGGVLYAVLLPPDSLIGQLVAVRDNKAGGISQTVLAEGVTSYLPGFFPQQGFVF